MADNSFPLSTFTSKLLPETVAEIRSTAYLDEPNNANLEKAGIPDNNIGSDTGHSVISTIMSEARP